MINACFVCPEDHSRKDGFLVLLGFTQETRISKTKFNATKSKELLARNVVVTKND